MTRNSTGNGGRRPEHELRDAHAGLRRKALCDLLAKRSLQGVARLRARCQHDDLGEGRIRQFRIIAKKKRGAP